MKDPHAMNLILLQNYIQAHGHETLVQDGILYGLAKYSGTPSPLGSWEVITPTHAGARAWLGY